MPIAGAVKEFHQCWLQGFLEVAFKRPPFHVLETHVPTYDAVRLMLPGNC